MRAQRIGRLFYQEERCVRTQATSPSKLKTFLGRFRGVSTWRLLFCPAWFTRHERSVVGAAGIDRLLLVRE